MTAASAAASLPAEVTLSTCIGCGAMTLPADCPNGCGQERKLEVIPAAELDELTVLTEHAEAQAQTLRAAATTLAHARHPPEDYAATAATLLAANPPEPRLRQLLAQPEEPTVSWWCPRCGGVDSPQPCIGVCIRTPVRWANAERARAMRARAMAALAVTDELLPALSLVAHTHPQPGQEARHWRAVRERAARAEGSLQKR
jgi:hypothetical protein